MAANVFRTALTFCFRPFSKWPRPPQPAKSGVEKAAAASSTIQALEERFLESVGPERHEEALEVLAIGRLSWRLRDDDNVLVGRLESQLLRALELAGDRLRAAGRLGGRRAGQPRGRSSTRRGVARPLAHTGDPS